MTVAVNARPALGHVELGENFLAHYGVKGMKWGVRKDRSANPKSSRALVKEARKHGKAALKPSMDARIDRIFGAAAPLKYSELSTKRTTIARGEELYRLTKRKDEVLRDMTYVSTNEKDRLRYRAVLSSPRGLMVGKRSYTPTYEATFKATKKLVSPSEKERFDAFTALLDAKEIPVGLVFKHKITGRQYLSRMGYDREIKKLEATEAGEKFYHQFVGDQFMNTPINRVYFSSLREKGFNALIDDNDRGILSDEPLMILDTQGSIKRTSIRQLTNDEINRSIASLTPIDVKK